MTLVIAKKIKNKISFSSDSRITFGSEGYIDFGIKIFSVPMKIYSPTDSITEKTTVDYSYTIGLAVIGSAINAYTVKESIYEILQNLQYIPSFTDISMYNISKLVFKVYNKTTFDLAPIIRRNGLCEILIGGFCPNQNKVRVFKFSVIEHADRIEPYYIEILEDEDTLFFGQGQNEGKRIFENNKLLTPLQIIKEVIKSKTVETVGGGLQYGEFINSNFQIFGIQDYDLNPDGTFKDYLHTLRGINLYKDEFEREETGFHIAYTFKMPFEDEINTIFKNQNQNL